MTSWMPADTLNMGNKAVFFDRDGTLNVEKDYLYRPEDFQWEQDAVEAIKYCHEQGYLVIVVTNQSGVARGYYKEEDILRLHEYMDGLLAREGTKIDGYYYCPHHPQAQVERYRQNCSCRKPLPGLVIQAIKDFDIEPSRSLMIGDKPRDVECGQAAGVKGVLYQGGSLLMAVKNNLIKG